MAKKIAFFNDVVNCAYCKTENYIELGFDEDSARVKCGDCDGVFLASLEISVEIEEMQNHGEDAIIDCTGDVD